MCSFNLEKKSYSSENDYIFINNYEKEYDIESFIYIIRSTGFQGKIIIFIKEIFNNLDLLRCNIEFIITNFTNNLPFSIQKYENIYNFINKPNFFSNRILIINSLNLFFIQDPFKLFYNPNRLYSLKLPINLLNISIPNNCLNFWNKDLLYYYDNLFLAGGENHIKRFLKLFLENKIIKECNSNITDYLLLNYYGNYRNFESEYVHFIALVLENPEIFLNGEEFIQKTKVLSSNPNITAFPTLILNYKNSNTFLEFISEKCRKH